MAQLTYQEEPSAQTIRTASRPQPYGEVTKTDATQGNWRMCTCTGQCSQTGLAVSQSTAEYANFAKRKIFVASNWKKKTKKQTTKHLLSKIRDLYSIVQTTTKTSRLRPGHFHKIFTPKTMREFLHFPHARTLAQISDHLVDLEIFDLNLKSRALHISCSHTILQ